MGFNKIDPVRINIEFYMDESIDLLKIILENAKADYKPIIEDKIFMIYSLLNLNNTICLDNYYNDDIIRFTIEGDHDWFNDLSDFINIDIKDRKIYIEFEDNQLQFCAAYDILYFDIEKME